MNNQLLRIELKNFELDVKRKVYTIELLENIDTDILNTAVHDLFCDEVIEEIISKNNPDPLGDHWVEIGFKPGVTDNIGKTAQEGLQLKGIDCIVYSSFLYAHSNYKFNELIETKLVLTDQCLDRFDKIKVPKVTMSNSQDIEYIDLQISDEQLLELNKERCLALSLNELHCLKNYTSENNIKFTDVELEIIAQTWSEHCKHKIFAAEINYSEEVPDSFKKIGNQKISSLYKTFVKKSTKDSQETFSIDWLKSVFSDNAGIVRFDKNIDLCIKVETHNSPSALDPYGGALTGILGVNRDIIGTGMGALPLANTNVFCTGPYHWDKKDVLSYLPAGLLMPHEILKGIHKGVEDGGNKSGIPTVNGAMCFDDSYSGKPLVYCGTVGVLPQKLKSGRDAFKKYHEPGDKIVIVGGRVGADGIHGATFSSMELDESAPATAVQIGDPITQKRVCDFLMEARDLELYSSITDNGAGGLSSSVGEMAEFTNGAEIELTKCLFKYPGLSPWEIVISESQERMTVAVPKHHLQEFLNLSKERSVESVCIGEFTNSGKFTVKYNNETVANLELSFLHDGLPEMNLDAHWNGPQNDSDNYLKGLMPKKSNSNKNLSEKINEILSDENIASKKYWVEQYDHEVKGSTLVRPFIGNDFLTPNDSGVVSLENFGGEKDNGVAIGCGINPYLSEYDPYLMALYSVDEAVRNCISQGADPAYICLLDNFCWPDPIVSEKNPNGKYKLGQLVRCNAGLYDIVTNYGMPLVSGKDSMKNDFRGKNNNGDDIDLSIRPTLLVTAMGKVNTKTLATSEFKAEGDLVYSIGDFSCQSLIGSRFSFKYDIANEEELLIPDLKTNLERYKKIHHLITENIIESIHDISEGGLLVSLFESLFFSIQDKTHFGIDLPDMSDHELFNERMGCFIVSIKKSHKDNFLSQFSENEIKYLGELNSSATVELNNEKINVKEAYCSWQGAWNKGEML